MKLTGLRAPLSPAVEREGSGCEGWQRDTVTGMHPIPVS
jgi:hypothetical protein